jgi:hypothetical protein
MIPLLAILPFLRSLAADRREGLHPNLKQKHLGVLSLGVFSRR